MALRQVRSRQMSWYCRTCPEGSKQNQNLVTTEAAERHADEMGHIVLALGIITYDISQGSVETEDPFAPRIAMGGSGG